MCENRKYRRNVSRSKPHCALCLGLDYAKRAKVICPKLYTCHREVFTQNQAIGLFTYTATIHIYIVTTGYNEPSVPEKFVRYRGNSLYNIHFIYRTVRYIYLLYISMSMILNYMI